MKEFNFDELEKIIKSDNEEKWKIVDDMLAGMFIACTRVKGSKITKHIKQIVGVQNGRVLIVRKNSIEGFAFINQYNVGLFKTMIYPTFEEAKLYLLLK